jgi:GH35 family endo-1,4-beta-xylanase
VYAWDAVNEAFNEDGTIRSTLWSDSPGIGLTGTLDRSPSMESNLRRLTRLSLGVQVQITELDVRIRVDSSGNAGAADLPTQARIYGDIVALA